MKQDIMEQELRPKLHFRLFIATLAILILVVVIFSVYISALKTDYEQKCTEAVKTALILNTQQCLANCWILEYNGTLRINRAADLNLEPLIQALDSYKANNP